MNTTSALYDSSSSSKTETVPNITRETTRSGAAQEAPNEAVIEFFQWINENSAVSFGKVISKEELHPRSENQPVVVREPLRLQRCRLAEESRRRYNS